MSEVWIVRWEHPDDMEVNITLWTSEQDALKQALSEIQNEIDNNWDMDDTYQSQYADEIKRLSGLGKLRQAMVAWNDYQDNHNDEYGEWYSVSKQEVLSMDDEVVTSALPVAFKPSTTGATCRGPCKQYNEYAYADRRDGTHLCRQCSTFQHILELKLREIPFNSWDER
jgi:hypothetical protein